MSDPDKPPPPKPKPPLPVPAVKKPASAAPPLPPPPKKDTATPLAPPAAPEKPAAANAAAVKGPAAEPKAALPAPTPPPTPKPPTTPAPPPASKTASDPGPIKAPLGSSSPAWLTNLTQTAKARAADVKRFAQEQSKGKPPWFLPVVSGGGALVLLILVLAIGKAACGSKASASVASSAQPASSSAEVTASSVATAAPAVPAAPKMTCALAGAQRRIAQKALAASGVEVRAVGSEIGVAFASSPNDATLTMLTPETLATTNTVHARAGDPIRRVVALSRAQIALDVDRKGDPLKGRRTLAADSPAAAIDVGATEEGFAWAPHHGDKGPIKLWGVPQADKPIEQIRGDSLPDAKGFAVAFRQGGTVYAGAFGGTPPAPVGPLVHVEGLGPTGGSPAIAASGDRVMMAWADRAAESDPWRLRIATFRVGDEGVQTKSFTPPAGGPGEQTMSPDLTALGAGRFLLVWTEGISTHQVRGAVLGDDASAIDPFAISQAGVDAGQGQAATLADGRGVVAFLSSTAGDFYEAVAAPLKCEEKH